MAKRKLNITVGNDMDAQEFFMKWSENCRIFTDYKPMHSHEDLLRFAEDYHKHKIDTSPNLD